MSSSQCHSLVSDYPTKPNKTNCKMHSKFLIYTKPELVADLWILDRDETWPGSVQETGETNTKKTDMNVKGHKRLRYVAS